MGIVLEGLKLSGGGLAAPAVLLEFERDLLAFLQASEASALDRGDVDEDVIAALVGLDEAKAFLAVKPFYGSGSHR